MTSPSFDNGIPELTEVIVADAAPPVAPSPVAPPLATKPATPTFTASAAVLRNEVVQTRAPAELPDEEWRRIETEVRKQIAHQVLGRIDLVLEQRVRDSLADVLQTAVEGLANEIKQGLQATLEETIARAVAQEITRLKTTKR